MAEGMAVKPPSWLSKAEKTTFRQVIAARNEMGRPVSTAERDAVADYAATRRRIVDLRRLQASAVFQKDQISAASAVSAATKLARQLGRDLGLGGGEKHHA